MPALRKLAASAGRSGGGAAVQQAAEGTGRGNLARVHMHEPATRRGTAAGPSCLLLHKRLGVRTGLN